MRTCNYAVPFLGIWTTVVPPHDRAHDSRWNYVRNGFLKSKNVLDKRTILGGCSDYIGRVQNRYS